MAPSASRKRTTIRAKAKRTTLPLSEPVRPTSQPSLFPSSKKDKQRIKHSAFVSKIEKSSAKSSKRRRPNKKLAANLESLADALPGLDEGNGEEVVVGQAKIQRKSLKSRPGAMKRKERVERMERERFQANLAQMATTGGGSAIADRWAALKNHVKSTVEQKAEFARA